MDDFRSNPFPGLRPFNPYYPEEQEQHLFFGREGQSVEILRRLREKRFLAVVGTSGSGKSSLIRAGLLPDLDGGFLAGGADWRMAIFRPIGDPIGNLARALNKPHVLQTEAPAPGEEARSDLLVEVSLRRSGRGLVEATRLARLRSDQILLVVVDQFEELFRFANAATSTSQADDAAAFVKLLLEAVHQTEVPIYVVITMRSDFIGDCSRFQELPEAVTAGMYLVPRMTRDQRREAIHGPVAVESGTIAPRLVNRLLNEAGDNPDQLPVLQHALMRTWEHWAERTRGKQNLADTPIDLEDYEAIGGLENALSHHADEAYNALPTDAHREIARRMFQCLTEKGADNREVRRPTSARQIAKVAHAPVEDVIAVVEEFRKQGRSFLNTPARGPLAPESLIDISHESLIRQWTRLKQWVNEEAESARTYRRLADAADRLDRGEAEVSRGLELQNYLAWREREQPTAEWAERYAPNFGRVMSYLDLSRDVRDAEEAEKEHQRREREAEKDRRRREQLRQARKYLAVVSVLAVLALLAGVFGWVKEGAARRAEAEAIAKKKEADSARDLATRRENEANDARALAVREKDAADVARADAEKAEKVAVQNEQAARRSEQRVRLGALREQKAEWITVSDELRLLNDLIEVSTPAKAAQYREWKLGLLIRQGKRCDSPQQCGKSSDASPQKAEKPFADALKEADLSVKEAPDSESAHTEDGYIHLLRNEPAEALKEFEFIRDKINPRFPLNSLNMAITLAALGRNSEASPMLEEAVREATTSLMGAGEGQVPQEITDATGRTTLSVNSESMLAALIYLRANFAAYWGDNGFEAKLKAADEHLRKLDKWPGDQQDALLVPITWAWVQKTARPADYGALAAEGALWERAGYRDYAARSYAGFLEEHKQHPDPRYSALARWVKSRLLTIDPHGSLVRAKRVEDPGEVELKAEISQSRNDLEEAEGLLSSLIKQEPANTRLYLERARVYLDLSVEPRKKTGQMWADLGKLDEQISLAEKELNPSDTQSQDSSKSLGQRQVADPVAQAARKAWLQTHLKSLNDQRTKKEAERKLLIQEENAWYDKTIQDCNHVLSSRPNAAEAYILRAYARYFEQRFYEKVDAKGKSAVPLAADDPILKDLREGLSLSQNYWAMTSLSYLLTGNDVLGMKPNDPRLVEALRLHELYKDVAPWGADQLAKLAQMLFMEKRYPEAMQAIEAAIAADPSKTSYYETRAHIEKDMGKNPLFIERNRARGYRRAADILGWSSDKLKNEEGEVARRESWKPMQEIAKEKNNVEVFCDPEITVCTENRVVAAHGERILTSVQFVGLVKKTPGEGKDEAEAEVEIDRGSEDGIVDHISGNVYSLASAEGGHERDFKQIGTGEVTSVNLRTARVKVKLTSAEGDGMVRSKDLVYLMARMPGDRQDSKLWDLARFHITLADRQGKILLDYRTLYSKDTPDVEDRLYSEMLADLHAAGHSDNPRMKERLRTARFEGKTLEEALQGATRDDLEQFFDYAFKNRDSYFGHEWKLYEIYEPWLLYGSNSRLVYCGIESVAAGDGKVRTARISRGSDDGVVTGVKGTVFSLYSKHDKTVRHVAKIGTGEVLSVEPRSAVVRITLFSPAGDGLVRPEDNLWIRVRVPEKQGASDLWVLTEYNIAITDKDRNLIVDYRTLYGKETPELDNQIYSRMLADLKQTATMKLAALDTKLEQGRLAGRTLRDGMREATRADLEKAIKYMTDNPSEYYGHKWNTAYLYAIWVVSDKSGP
ncbi:MAG TPA: hypothetical protein VLW54_02770 [Candidatus Acidoferrales bacterium]|nr:hypothetical protein [Candidatus Acidoferrales bacterium]